jgi:heme oxygenase
MSILRNYTNEKHRAAEATPFVQYMLHGNITADDYAVFLQQMELVYRNIEYFAEISHLLHELPDIKRADYMREDLRELGYNVTEEPLPSIKKWCERIVYLYYTDKSQILAHVYVRHMGDMYGGKIIAKKVPGSGKCYGFEDRPALIKALDAKLSTDIVDEALVAFDLAIEFFNELQEKLNDRGSFNGS